MRNLLIVLALVAMPIIANAGEVYKVCGLEMPCTCEIDCVYLDIECCYCEGSMDAILVEFVGADDVVLGSVSLGGPWCGPCSDDGYYGTLDNPVSPRDVEYVRLSSDGTISMEWMALKVRSKGRCCNYDWDKIFKGDMCCYESDAIILY